RELRLGIELDGTMHWLDDDEFEWAQSYVPGAMVLRTTARTRGLDVEINDVVHPAEPALVRHVTCSHPRARLVARFDGGESLAVARGHDEVVCAAGASHEEAAERAAAHLAAGFERHADERRRHDAAHIAEA